MPAESPKRLPEWARAALGVLGVGLTLASGLVVVTATAFWAESHFNPGIEFLGTHGVMIYATVLSVAWLVRCIRAGPLNGGDLLLLFLPAIAVYLLFLQEFVELLFA